MPENTITINRLTKEVYDAFSKQFRPIVPNSQTTQIEAGYALGVQAVLQKLREGLVME
jgi:hypothetical protein